MSTFTAHTPEVLRYSPETQRVVNHLPYHHKIRRERSSVGQAYINNIIGTTLQHLKEQIYEAADDAYLFLANKDQTDIIWTVDLPAGVDYPFPEKIKNMLRNSSFEIWTNELRVPDWWHRSITQPDPTTYLTDITVSETGLIGNRCLKYSMEAGGSAYIYQVVPNESATPEIYLKDLDPELAKYPFTVGDRVTLSAYIKFGTTGLSDTDASVILSLEGQLTDGVSNVAPHTATVPISTCSDGSWHRIELSFIVSNPYESADVRLQVDALGSMPVIMYADALQLERSPVCTEWQPHIYDRPFYFDRLNLFGVAPAVSEFGTRSQHVALMDDFWRTVPTRISLSESRSLSTPAEAGRAGFSYEIDFWKDEWNIEWVIDDYDGTDYIYKKGVPEEAADKYGRDLLAPPNAEGFLITGYMSGLFDCRVDMHALTYFQDRLWIIGEGVTDQDEYVSHLQGGDPDKTMCLFITDPTTTWPEPEHLEVLTVMQLPDWPAGVTPVRVDFRLEDADHIYIAGDNDVDYCYRLYRDYFVLDALEGRAYFRENYDSVCVQPMFAPQKTIRQTVRRP